MDHADIDHTGLTGVGGSVATDSIWDAAGDLAVGSGANTAAKLTKGSDGDVLTVTSGTVGWAAAGTGGNPLSFVEVRYTTGDITLGSGTTPVAVSGPGDLVIAAATGDLLMCGLSARSTDTDADSLGMDMATIVSAAAVNYVSSRSGTPTTTGVAGWYFGSGRVTSVMGEAPYLVQAGDISGGNVTLRLYYRVSGVGKVLSASSSGVLHFWVRNLGQ